MALIWLAAMVLFGVMEAATVNLVSIFFLGGALAAFIAALLHGPLWLQILLFLAVSAALLAGLRPLVRKKLNPRITRTNADSVVGRTGLVTQAIDDLEGTGQVKIDGLYWTARTRDRRKIPVGATVTVSGIEGVKVIVTEADPVPCE